MLIVLKKNIKTFLFLLLLCLCILLPVKAGQLNIQLENDGLFANDSNYTNGFALGWESKPQLSHQGNPPSSMPLLFQLQHAFRLPVSKTRSAWGGKLSQRMWTPNEIELAEPQSDDRPYAGILELESHSADYGPRFAQKNWLALGIMGPNSMAEQVQKKVHSITGSTSPQGWQHQIQNQVTLQFSYEVDALLYRAKKSRGPLFDHNQWEVSSYSHIALGNFKTEASLGLLLRWGGMLNETFGRLSSHFGHSGNTSEIVRTSNFFVFSKMQIAYRFNDLSIEGDLPYESEIDIQHEQVKLALGINWTVKDFALTWSLNSYTKAFTTDNKSWYSYGSLTLSCAI
jgi:hypothetical protein